jgi:hypothetical protein
MDTLSVAQAAIPDSAGSNEIVINEILFNPQSGGSRFIELFNRSPKVLDLAKLVLSNQDFLLGEPNPGKPLTAQTFLLFPGEYAVITPDPGDICSRYRCWDENNFIKMEQFPVLNDDTGTAVLVTKGTGSPVDKIQYDHEMHYPLLATDEGVSLERLSAGNPSGYRENWHSASETEGFATPGRQNSQRITDAGDESALVISPEIFSPDNDGIDDVLCIKLNPGAPGYQASVIVFDARGRIVRHLENNTLISDAEIFSWDGITNDRTKAAIGIYIIYVEILKPDGIIKRFRRTAVLGGKF